MVPPNDAVNCAIPHLPRIGKSRAISALRRKECNLCDITQDAITYRRAAAVNWITAACRSPFSRLACCGCINQEQEDLCTRHSCLTQRGRTQRRLFCEPHLLPFSRPLRLRGRKSERALLCAESRGGNNLWDGRTSIRLCRRHVALGWEEEICARKRRCALVS